MRNDDGLTALVLSMYDTVVPPMGMAFMQDSEDMTFTDMRAFYARTGLVPVLDIGPETPLFDDADVYYKMIAWITYRAFGSAAFEGSALTTFDLLVNDALRFNRENRGLDVSRVIMFLDAMLNVTQEYAAKFGHDPVNVDKFITSFMKHGRSSVLRVDIY